MRDDRIKTAADVLAALVGPTGLTVRELGEALRLMCLRNAKSTRCQNDGTEGAWADLARAAVEFSIVGDTHRDLVN